MLKNHGACLALASVEQMRERTVDHIHIHLWHGGFTYLQDFIDEVTTQSKRIKNKFTIAAPDALGQLLLTQRIPTGNLVGVLSVHQQHLRHIGHAAIQSCCPLPQVIVFALFPLPVIHQFLCQRCLDQDRRMGKHGPKYQSHLDRLIGLRMPKHTVVLSAKKLHPTATNFCISILYPLELPREAMRQRDVIRIHARNPLAARHPDPFIQGLDQPPVFPGNQNDPRIPAKLLQDLHGLIGGPIVNDDEFKIRESLIEN
ncbi:MAG: hypothetical protein WCK94_09715 [Comamonadaceae bacterium]